MNSLAISVVSLAAHFAQTGQQATHKGNVHAVLTIAACVLPLCPAHPLVSSAGGDGGPSAPGRASQSSRTSDHSQQPVNTLHPSKPKLAQPSGICAITSVSQHTGSEGSHPTRTRQTKKARRSADECQAVRESQQRRRGLYSRPTHRTYTSSWPVFLILLILLILLRHHLQLLWSPVLRRPLRSWTTTKSTRLRASSRQPKPKRARYRRPSSCPFFCPYR